MNWIALAREYRDEGKKEERLAHILDIEDGIYQRAAAVVDAFISFHEVAPQQQEPPPEWVTAYGEEGARQRLQVAKSGWLPQSIAPAAVKTAAQVMTGIARGRKFQMQKGQVTLNAQINLPQPTSAAHTVCEYEVREIDK